MDKQKFHLEFAMRCIPTGLLWSYISSASGLKEWFADAVSVSGKKYTFDWNGQLQTATVISRRDGVSIKFRWDDEPARAYFEMAITVNEMTDNTTLTITDLRSLMILTMPGSCGRHRWILCGGCSVVEQNYSWLRLL